MKINCVFYYVEDGGSSTGMAEVVEAQTTGKTQENKATAVVGPNSDMLQHLVTEAVKKVLADKEVTVAEKFPENIVSQVVEELKPTLASSSTASMRNITPNIGKHIAIPTPITKPVTCVYNPTPIAELKKRHIPVVSYMPTRESRVAVKRKCSPERVKPWLSIIQESSSSQQPEITYKPTAIVNTTDQDAVPDYVPTFKSDSSTSNSYDDGNSNDYQSKFKEAYYPKSKKRREEYVPKMVKAPLKTVQQLDDVTIDHFESQFDMIDEIFTSSHTVPNTSGQAKVLSSEDSQDYSLDIEPKFSDDELFDEDISKDKGGASVKKAERAVDVSEKEKKNLQHAKIDEQTSNKDSKIHNNHYDAKTGDIKSSDKSKQYKENDANKSSDKRKEGAKEDADKEKKGHKSHSKSKKKDRRDHHSSEGKDRDKSGHKSDSRSGHHSSSSKDKDKRRSSRDSKESSHKDKEHSRRDRRGSPKRDRGDHHKSNRQDKHKSKTSLSSSKSSKHTSSKSDKKHRSDSSRRPSTSRKSSEHKESNSERNSSDGSDYSPLNNIHPFADDEILEISDSDHDVQEECLKIFQVSNSCIYHINTHDRYKKCVFNIKSVAHTFLLLFVISIMFTL